MKRIIAIVIIILLTGSMSPAGDDNSSKHKEGIMKSEKDKNGLAELKITVIYDNDVFQEGLKSEWGFACMIEGAEKIILFDTGGDGAILMANMEKLGIDPGKIDVVVLSHKHWDHVGGLPDFLEKNSDVTVYMLESFPDKVKQVAENKEAEIVAVTAPLEICGNVYSTGEMGETIEEHALVLKTAKGLIVITGCAHPGIVEIAERAKELYKDDLLYVLGGFHLQGHGKSQLESIVNSFKAMGVKYASPCHCSGDKARRMFEDAYRDHYIKIGVGKIITLTDLN
jgi:7,8-dihydropterin-6-yl-methyl-4-(beta-D-ribofuranosyl)aminobenzene 5'-phosphate synthase